METNKIPWRYLLSLSLGNAVRQTSEDSIGETLFFLHFILRRKYYKKEIRKNIKTIRQPNYATSLRIL